MQNYCKPLVLLTFLRNDGGKTDFPHKHTVTHFFITPTRSHNKRIWLTQINLQQQAIFYCSLCQLYYSLCFTEHRFTCRTNVLSSSLSLFLLIKVQAAIICWISIVFVLITIYFSNQIAMFNVSFMKFYSHKFAQEGWSGMVNSIKILDLSLRANIFQSCYENYQQHTDKKQQKIVSVAHNNIN